MCQGEGSRIEAKYLKASRAPGEETSEKGFHVKTCIWHDACVQVETVQPAVPAAGKQMSSSHRADAPVKTCPTGQDGGGIQMNCICIFCRQNSQFHGSSYLSLTSCAAAMTEEMLLVSICSRATWAMGCEARRAERAACARCMFLQARHSWSPPASCERRRSHSARPMPLRGNTQGWNVRQKLGMSLKSHTTDI